jgi:hypothetical protein
VLLFLSAQIGGISTIIYIFLLSSNPSFMTDNTFSYFLIGNAAALHLVKDKFTFLLPQDSDKCNQWPY